MSETPVNKHYVLFAGICLFALLLRAWGAFDVPSFIGDEQMNVRGAEHYFENGHTKPSDWTHPPFLYAFVKATVVLLGDNPYGWRLAGVLVGVCSVAVLFLVSREFFSDARIACLAALLMAIEPLQVTLSRTNFREPLCVFLFLLGLYFLLRYRNGARIPPAIAGVFFGLSLATKWYYAVAIAVLLVFMIVPAVREGRPRWLGIARVFSALILTPAAIYLATFFPWFQRGYTLPEFVQMQMDAYQENQHLSLACFIDDFLKRSPSRPSEWFIKPLVTGVTADAGATWGRYFVFMNNFPVWLLAIPALLFLLYRVRKNADGTVLLLVCLTAAVYLQFTVVQRPIFLYSALVLLPFIYIAVAAMLVAFLDRLRKPLSWYYGLITVVGLWGLYLYPLVMAMQVPTALYRPLLSLGDMF